MTTEELSRELREQGVVLLRGTFAQGSLTTLKEAAARCFEAIGEGRSLPAQYRFSRSSHSVLLTALMDFGCRDIEDLTAPLSEPGIRQLLEETMGSGWTCKLEQSWVRKKFAPRLAPTRDYHLQDWHQDGALGVGFPAEAWVQTGPECRPAPPMTELLTCWIPLDSCGVDRPGLEFVRRRQPALVHFSGLADAALRRQFAPEDFWAPAMDFGDGLIFMKDMLHRTCARQEMRHDRLSVEYRIFKAGDSPVPSLP